MKKHLWTLLLFALVSFYFLTTDVLLNDKTAALLGQDRVMPIYALAMLLLGIGFMLFSLLAHRMRTTVSIKRMLFAAVLLSAAALMGFVLTSNEALFLAFVFLHMPATGILGGAVHYQAAVSLRDRIYTGRVVGMAIGLEAFMQVLLLSLISSAPVRVLILIMALGAACLLALWKELVIASMQKPYRNLTESVPTGRYLTLITSIVAIMSLMGGLNDGIVTAMQARNAVDMYSYPRLFYLAGVAAAGFIADIRSRRYLPVAILSVMVCSPVGVMFLNDPATYAVNACIFSLFAGFAILFFTISFLDIAPYTPNPMLWAGMGRVIRFALIAFGAVCSDAVFASIPFDWIVAAFIVMSMLLLVLFYLTGSLGGKKVSAALPQRTKSNMLIKAKNLRFTEREIKVLSCLLDSMQVKDIAKALCITERTVKFHITNIFVKAGVKNRMELLIFLSRAQKEESDFTFLSAKKQKDKTV